MKTTPTKFDKLVAQAAKLLEEARREKNADDATLYVYADERATAVELFWDEREQRGELAANGSIKLGRKP